MRYSQVKTLIIRERKGIGQAHRRHLGDGLSSGQLLDMHRIAKHEAEGVSRASRMSPYDVLRLRVRARIFGEFITHLLD